MLQIDKLHVRNFKSLIDFEMKLEKFNCIVGLNGSGKSTVLQFIDFMSQLMRGNIERWLGERRWKSTDIRSKLIAKKHISWTVEFSDSNTLEIGKWVGKYDPVQRRCVEENLEFRGASLRFSRNEIKITDTRRQVSKPDFVFEFQGSLLSALRESILPGSIFECKEYFAAIESLEMLAPQFLRQRTRASNGSLGSGGQNLASFLYEMPTEKKLKLEERVRKAYPQFLTLVSHSLKSGWKQLGISEDFDVSDEDDEPRLLPRSMTTDARHVNDGMLRLIALLAELESEHSFLLFDEIENGINPELVEYVVDALVHSSKQVVVTTHSPMVLNFLEDDVARKSVTYLYKTKSGETRAIPFFSIPSMSEKLTVMGPGEVFVDTNLSELEREISLHNGTA